MGTNHIIESCIKAMDEYMSELRDAAPEAMGCSWDVFPEIAKRMRAVEVDPLEDLVELRRTFDLIHEADVRGIKMWQEAHPGNDFVWPDRGKMIFWLLERLSARQAGHETDTL